MQNKLLIIGVIFTILMVAFGRNPYDEAQKEKADRLKGRDPLIMAIEEHNANGGSKFGIKTGSMNDWLGKNTSLNSGLEKIDRSTVTTAPTQVYRRPGTTPNAQMPAYDPETDTGNPYQVQNLPNANDQTQGGYYPPPPLPAANPHSRFQKLPPRSEMRLQLGSGQPFAFKGENVYTVDRNGNTVPMPDGTYSIHGGKATLTVRNGQHVIIN